MKRLTLIALSLICFAHGVSAKKPNGEAIASASPYATRAGLAIFKKGGNAFDAAVAVSSVLAVTEPFHSGIGGGGFWLLHVAKTNENHFIDGRERAPSQATADMFLDKSGKPIRRASLFGPKAAGIPGEPAALVYMAKHYGKLPLSVSLAPAIKLAREGYPVDHRYVELAREKLLIKGLRQYPASRKIFLDNGNAPEVGWVLKQTDLANTLESIAKKGNAGFYQGKVAKAMVNAVKHGNKEADDKRVQIEFAVSPDRVYMRFTDEGEGFSPEELPDPREEEHLECTNGRGVMLIHAMMTEVRYNERGNQVEMWKSRSEKQSDASE